MEHEKIEVKQGMQLTLEKSPLYVHFHFDEEDRTHTDIHHRLFQPEGRDRGGGRRVGRSSFSHFVHVVFIDYSIEDTVEIIEKINNLEQSFLCVNKFG